jgi:hypothetical protein
MADELHRKGLRVDRPELEELMRRSREAVEAMTPAERAAMHRAQAISFAYGNTHMANDRITRKMAEAVYDAMHPGESAYRDLLVRLLDAWDARPRGYLYSHPELEAWLDNNIGPTISEVRKAVGTKQ